MRYSERRQQEADFHARKTNADIVSHHSPWLRDEAGDLALTAKQPLPHPQHTPPNADNGKRFLYAYFLEQLEREKNANWKAVMLPGNDQLVAIHQVLEQIVILQSSQYSVSVHIYCVDGQLPSVK